MFSGIVEEKGRVKKIAKTSEGCVLIAEAVAVSKEARIGDSVSVNGVCLTVVRAQGKNVSFDVMEETFRRTNIGRLLPGVPVNLERPLKAGDRISGHFVTGHVDCTGRIKALMRRPNDYMMEIEFPEEKTAYVREKGSIAIDGVSLTVGEIKSNHIKVYLIPLTLKITSFGSKKTGDLVNIEFDILGKYSLDKKPAAKKGIDVNFLKEHGFA